MIYQFCGFTVDTDRFVLNCGESSVSIEPLAFNLLIYLIEARQRVVSRDELFEELWRGKVVSDAALAARLKDARKAIGDSGSRQEIIKTVHGRGYQFVATLSNEEVPKTSGIATSVEQLIDLSIPGDPSIAVLPFTVMSSDPEQSFFADGVVDDIITALSKIKRLLVVSRNSTFTYKGRAVDVRQVSQEQGVRYVLEGSVRKAGDRVRVSAQLIDATTGLHVWADRYDRDLKDIFAVQDEIMREIVTALDVNLREGEQQQVWSSGTRNLEAWECVRMATAGALGGEDDTRPQTTKLLEQALKLDPGYAIAWVMRGWVYFNEADVAGGIGSPDDRSAALKACFDCCHKSIELDPACSDGYGLLAMANLESGHFDKAVELSEKAIALAPNNAEIHINFGSMIAKSGNTDRGIELIKRAMRLSPFYRPGFLRALGIALRLAGDLELAVQCFRESLKRETGFFAPYVNLASTLGELGCLDQAKIAGLDVLRKKPDFSITDYTDGLAYRRAVDLERFANGLRNAGLPE
ncbi:MAG: TolB-like protein/Tfp pilus assembly protein PilF [Parasphingorhabdus sp.]|jgi:TolB-like protein/Tfp pilus assembly protein PilF